MQPFDQATALAVLCRAPASAVTALAEALLPELGPVDVLRHRTGLMMLPMPESAQGATFYLGEVLVSEAHVRLGCGEGYAMCIGRDTRHALAAAILDAARSSAPFRPRIDNFLAEQADALAAADAALLRAVEQTRVEMETF